MSEDVSRLSNMAHSKRSVAEEDTTTPNWVINSNLIWDQRRKLLSIGAIAFPVAIAVAFLWPKEYESSARIMPPGSNAGGAALVAALAGRSGGGLGSIGAMAGGLLGGRGDTPLFMDLLRSSTISGHLIDRFDLLHVYGKHYRTDAAKYLVKRTKIVDDKKSGVITLTVTDTDPVRARDLAQSYLDELNLLVNRTNTSSAHQERVFIEQRLSGVQLELGQAQQRLSDFSSSHSAIDIKEQTRAMVDAASQVQARLIVDESALESLRQIYGDGNVRVREELARIAVDRREIARLAGSSHAAETIDEPSDVALKAVNSEDGTYPALREMPRLAVPYAKLYREVQVQESVYQLLTQQYEMARIQEAKDVPVVSVIDPPGVPEKKSFPPRLILTLFLTLASVALAVAWILLCYQWHLVEEDDPVKELARRIGVSLAGPWMLWRTPPR